MKVVQGSDAGSSISANLSPHPSMMQMVVSAVTHIGSRPSQADPTSNLFQAQGTFAGQEQGVGEYQVGPCCLEVCSMDYETTTKNWPKHCHPPLPHSGK